MRITGIRTTPLALAFKTPYYWSGRCDLGAAVVLVEVATDEGIVGFGECIGGRPAGSVMGLIEGIAPLFVGESPYDVERLFARAYHIAGYDYAPRLANLSLAGLELALWDISGKAAGRPVHQLLGGACRSEISYFAFIQGDTADELAASAAEAVAANAQVIYMKVGRGEKTDLDNVDAVRQVIGGRKLRLDGNEAWDPLTAIRMIGLLERYEPEFIEQPTPSHSLSALKQVKEAVHVPIAADQAVFTAADVYEVCRRRAADVIVLGPHETGGLLAFKKAAAIAEAAGIRVCLHGQFVTGVSDCAQHQVGLTLPNLSDGNQIMHQYPGYRQY